MFKNAHVYRFTESFELTTDQIEAALQEQTFVPCSGIRPSSFGWVSPTGDEKLSHDIAGAVLLCARREDKVIPTSALGDTLNEKVHRLETLEGRPIRAKEKQRLKEDALAELLPRALPKSKQILGYISTSEDLLVIDTGSSPEAEMFLNCLRETFGELKVVPPQVKNKPSDTFTHWLTARKLPEHFSFGDACDLMDPEDGSSVTCRRQDLATSEIRAHLDAGKICNKISINWYGDLKVTIDKDLVLRQLKLITTDDESEPDSDGIQQLDADFAHLTLELSRFLPALYSALGGENRT